MLILPSILQHATKLVPITIIMSNRRNKRRSKSLHKQCKIYKRWIEKSISVFNSQFEYTIYRFIYAFHAKHKTILLVLRFARRKKLSCINGRAILFVDNRNAKNN